ncbi:Clavaminate synthase-like protein [Thozetella sp. PMI_491]|nr:Clavaminate synthase-like protein [Thozetella sp. PMI_491]
MHLHSPLCWIPDSIPNGSSYVVELTAADVEFVEAAVTCFKSTNLGLPFISPENFPLPPHLVHILRQASVDVHHGRGFSVIRGVKTKIRSDEDEAIIFCGISSHFGKVRATGPNGMAMDHLRDASHDRVPEGLTKAELHPSKTMAPLKFHADRKLANTIALYVKTTASRGGNQYLASFWTVYNQMMAERPELLRVLAQDFPWPEVINDELKIFHHPVMFHHQGKVFCQLVYRVCGTNILNQAQLEALRHVEEYARKSCIEIVPQPGDIQFINNYALLHARQSWVDGSARLARHYLRLGLHDPTNAWPRPPAYEWLFDASLHVPPDQQTIPLEDFDPYGATALALDHG